MARTLTMDEELKLVKNATSLRNWLTTLPNTAKTVDACRDAFKQHATFSNPAFIMSWGDSFLLDQMFFRTGGQYKLSDFPELENVSVGHTVFIHGAPHYVTKVGLLTFEAVDGWQSA